MRDHLISIIRDARSIQIGADSTAVKQFAEAIETSAKAALHGSKYIIPSKLFGEITIPQDVITAMSNGDDDMWFSHGCALDINVFYDGVWLFTINPVKNGGTDTGNLLESGKL
jgi:hypothetical protein